MHIVLEWPSVHHRFLPLIDSPSAFFSKQLGVFWKMRVLDVEMIPGKREFFLH